MLHGCPSLVQSSDDLLKIFDIVGKAAVCPGNPDHQFVSLHQARGSAIRSDRGSGEKVAFIDSNQVIDLTGQCYPATIRRCNCDILFMESVALCASCDRFALLSDLLLSLQQKRP